MHILLLVEEYHETIKQLSKNKCWACQEGLASNNSMHDCEQDLNLIIEYFFDEATFFVNIEMRKRDFQWKMDLELFWSGKYRRCSLAIVWLFIHIHNQTTIIQWKFQFN
jgi:hypothetical protein